MLSGYPAQSHEMLFDAHTRAFTAFGGVSRRGIYDNMKTAVDKVSKGGGRIINTRFFAMTAHYLFELVLESGITSAEHVLNVLARLNQSESPARVETSLKLDEEPQADTARYDHLNTLDAPYV